MGILTIIGAGNVGQAIAGHMTLDGHEVRLYSPWDSEFDPITAQGGLKLSGDVEGLAVPHLMTSDLAQAVAGAEVIIVAVPAFAHNGVSERLAPVVEPDQLVLFQPSALGSGLELAKSFADQGREPCLIGETATSLYTCRLQAPGQVYIGRIKPSVQVAATPNHAVTEVQQRLKPFFGDRYSAANDALAVGLSRIGAIYHVPPALLNFKTVEDGARLPHNTLVTPQIAEVINELDKERLGLAQELGVEAVTFPQFLELSYGVTEGTLSERIQKSYGPLNFPEPDSPSHRYFTEDIPYSLVPWSSIAEQIGYPMPLTNGIIKISSILCGRDWHAQARTAQKLGLVGASAERIHKAFLTGVI